MVKFKPLLKPENSLCGTKRKATESYLHLGEASKHNKLRNMPAHSAKNAHDSLETMLEEALRDRGDREISTASSIIKPISGSFSSIPNLLLKQ